MPGFVHGHKRHYVETPTYNSWRAMKARCDNPKNARYTNYGGRGINYDSRWAVFEVFLYDMGVRPVGTNLGRKDADESYCLDNCFWQDVSENSSRREVSKK